MRLPAMRIRYIFASCYSFTINLIVMKKIILSLFALGIVGIAGAQVRIGIQGGATLSTASFTKEADLKTTTRPVYGPALAVVADIPVTGNWHLRPALQYLQKGVKYKGVSNDGIINGRVVSDLRTHYAELPVFMTWQKSLGNKSLFLGAGPSVSVGIDGQVEVASYLETIPEPIVAIKGNPFKRSADIEEPMKRLEWGAAAMAGLEFRNGLFITAQYHHGLRDIDGSAEDGVFRNRTAGLSVGYFFGRGR
jgi:hypothetical protein